MATQLDDALSAAALNATERRAVARIVARLEAELGADLLAVWLYGSRARGEADPIETHHDRRSDIDMMAIVGPGRDVTDFKWASAALPRPPLGHHASARSGSFGVTYVDQILDDREVPDVVREQRRAMHVRRRRDRQIGKALARPSAALGDRRFQVTPLSGHPVVDRERIGEGASIRSDVSRRNR